MRKILVILLVLLFSFAAVVEAQEKLTIQDQTIRLCLTNERLVSELQEKYRMMAELAACESNKEKSIKLLVCLMEDNMILRDTLKKMDRLIKAEKRQE